MSIVLHQYRSTDKIYFFREKQHGDISLTIFDIFKKVVFKRTIRDLTFSHTKVAQLLMQKQGAKAIKLLGSTEFLPKKYQLPGIEIDAINEIVEKNIQRFKCNYRKIADDILICPITQDIFKEAMTDVHGHTFEKVAIERHLQNKSLCPLNRQPIEAAELVNNICVQNVIASLDKNRFPDVPLFCDAVMDNHGHSFEKAHIAMQRRCDNICPINNQPITHIVANRVLQDFIDEIKKNESFNFTIKFKEENMRLAEDCSQQAKSYEASNELKKALEYHIKAFEYAHHWYYFIAVPNLFKALNEPKNVYIAYLYLAKYQLQSKSISEAIFSLEAAQKGPFSSFEITYVLIDLYSIQRPDKAKALIEARIENLSDKIKAYKRIIDIQPSFYDAYYIIGNLETDSHKRSHILYKGALEAIARGNSFEADIFINRALLYSDCSVLDKLVLFELNRRVGDNALIKTKLLHLLKMLEYKKSWEDIVLTCKLLLSFDNNSDYYKKIIHAYTILKKHDKAKKWSIRRRVINKNESRSTRLLKSIKRTLRNVLIN